MADHTHPNPLVTLSDSALPRLPKNVKAPIYDRSKLTPGIVHIGLGNFHRAHQAWYLHQLMQKGLAHDWAIIGAGVRPGDAAMRERLLRQDCLTTLVELDPDREAVEVIGPMVDFVEVDKHNAPLIAAMSDPQIRIVSLTVTEGGYYVSETGGLDTDHPDIQHDANNPDRPITAYGAMVAAYKARRELGAAPFAGQSCDNLLRNGDVLRNTVVGLARLSDPELAQWIDETADFPNAMVDCIVPATGEAELALARRLGIDDTAPVTHENFRQWVLQDNFCDGRPPWELAGVTITNNVHAHEAMKIRVLNGGHQMLANVGEVMGLQTIADCMAQPTVAAFFHKVQTNEVLPHVQAVPGLSPKDYLSKIEKRFSNPKIHDTTRRVAFDGSARHPGFILPTLSDALHTGGGIGGLALVEALWARMCAGTNEEEGLIAANDPNWTVLNSTALQAKNTPSAWLKMTHIYGDLVENAQFHSAFSHWLSMIWSLGAEAALRHYINSSS
ncbi:mannitol dehydrogenase family protein [Shimia sagamensis]|uniref:Mannitol 2-dehydrogenase n=1 Tax=Shimia sagamensis TaxID=1566352 RepID=A0ABY1NXM5_9RHOB|nr:mannitol dehydrogenase family protein [Shimia sagamensis]SMP21273.1 mannitol 2-dehydrogenase [Shimia sagamensis]